ncbi:glyoxalase [Roseibium aquae]|uniref:Glyoxalase n=1 Tax=Roseibium aquae TaxID=1323746 RepID=A0A916X156_9HYPH|nr:VOC family protein [Roseibium aquae]GGB50427.1 glyoxalase [Roseibium aquae]
MDQRISMITLAVDDVSRTRRFFSEGLGWTPIDEPGGSIVFFQIGGSILAIYGREALQHDLGRPVSNETSGAVTLAWNGRSEAEVDAAYAKALSAGAETVTAPTAVFWGGYSGTVEIPGGHLLEIAYNPFWPIAGDGSVTIPQ